VGNAKRVIVQGSRVSDYLRVLIIDDSLTIRAMLEELIEREPGCRVVGMASTASEARSMMTDLIPNVVTLDLNMPGIDGMTVLDQLRSKDHPPVVVVSSATSAGSSLAVEAVRRGAYVCFDKAKILADSGSLVQHLRAAARAGSSKAHPADPI
jgi:chemotaxis response regulator CheB